METDSLRDVAECIPACAAIYLKWVKGSPALSSSCSLSLIAVAYRIAMADATALDSPLTLLVLCSGALSSQFHAFWKITKICGNNSIFSKGKTTNHTSSPITPIKNYTYCSKKGSLRWRAPQIPERVRGHDEPGQHWVVENRPSQSAIQRSCPTLRSSLLIHTPLPPPPPPPPPPPSEKFTSNHMQVNFCNEED